MKMNFLKSSIRILLIFGCIFSFSKLFSQNQIKGIIQDADTKTVIPFANILNLEDGTGSNSNENGEFQIAIKKLPASVQISYIGYKTDTVIITDTENQEIFLKRDLQNLPLIEVSANQKLAEVESSGFLPRNFVVWKDQIFLLSKNGTFGKHQIEIYNAQGDLEKKHKINIGNIQNLKVNCLDQLYLSNNQNAIRLDYQNESLVLIEKTPVQKFESVFKNCTCGDDNSLLYELKMENGLLKRYILADKTSGNSLLFKEVFYKKRSELYDSDKYLIARADASSNMGDISAAENTNIRDLQEEADFLQTVFYKNYLENYLFSKDRKIMLFNNDEKKIESFDQKGTLINSVEMQFMPAKNAGFNAIILDRETGIFYSIIKESGKFVLGQVDLKTGTLITKNSLEASTIKKAEIINGRLFILGIPTNAKEVRKYEFLTKNIF